MFRPQRFASDSASQKFHCDTVSLPSAPWAHESQRQIVHTDRSVKLPSFRHFQDQFLTTSKEKWGKKNGPVFRKVLCFSNLTFRGPLASHNSNPYPNRSRIARYNATKSPSTWAFLLAFLSFSPCEEFLAFGVLPFFLGPWWFWRGNTWGGGG